MSRFKRIALAVLDSVGIGEMPDAPQWGDAGSDTLGHILEKEAPRLPNLRKMGLGNIRSLPNMPPVEQPSGCFGKAAILSNGKDTTVGHWEIAGLITPVPFPTYSHGFPSRIIEPFIAGIGRDILGNKPASGTAIIDELGPEHMTTGKPIIYTSADSVFQIAVHEEVVPLPELYGMCRVAREILDGPDRVARVIARPFIGVPGAFHRTSNRKDFAIPPPQKTLLDSLLEKGLAVIGVGKIASIFDNQGVPESLEAHNNTESMDQTIRALKKAPAGIIFTNFVDFDMLWGHRNDSKGYARGLEEFDLRLPELIAALRKDDLLILCADHGCDPTTVSTDHSREYVPILAYSPLLTEGTNLGTRSTMADIGQTIAENFQIKMPVGTSFLAALQ